jgi:hypothetical protein
MSITGVAYSPGGWHFSKSKRTSIKEVSTHTRTICALRRCHHPVTDKTPQRKSGRRMTSSYLVNPVDEVGLSCSWSWRLNIGSLSSQYAGQADYLLSKQLNPNSSKIIRRIYHERRNVRFQRADMKREKKDDKIKRRVTLWHRIRHRNSVHPQDEILENWTGELPGLCIIKTNKMHSDRASSLQTQMHGIYHMLHKE